MQNKKKPYKPWIKRGPLKTFLFFLGFSAVIWLFVQFSKEYIEPVELPLKYINVPQDKILGTERPKFLDLRVKDYGFNIARYKFFPPELAIDINETRIENEALIYDLQAHKAALLSQINLEYEEATFMQPAIEIPYEQRAVKTVKVVPNINLGFSVGYSALEEVVIEPDSVQISGPEGLLDTLQQVQTVPLTINNISKDIKDKIKLDKSNLEKVNFFRDEVNFVVRTDKFTEGQVEIPVEVINVPKDLNVVVFPKEVVVFYQVSLKNFDKVTAEDFKVVVDFENALESDGYLLAQVQEQPKLVNNVRLSEKRIQFVIKR